MATLRFDFMLTWRALALQGKVHPHYRGTQRCYLLHFDRKIGSEKHAAQHYCGCVRVDSEEQLLRRLYNHRIGHGAKILKVLMQSYHGHFQLVRVWQGASFQFEQKLKQTHRLHEFCPICAFTNALK